MSLPIQPQPNLLPAIAAPKRARNALDVAAVLALMYSVRYVGHRSGYVQNVGAVAVLFGMVLATGLLATRGETWGMLGWRRPNNLGTATAWTIGTFVALMLILPILLQPIATALRLPPQHFEQLGDLRGNTGRFLFLLLPLSWGTAAFGEELLYRGFFNTRLARALGSTPVALVTAALGQAALFGFAHLYLGPTGVLNAFAIGLVSAGVYAASGRNLWPLIIAHGLVDTVGLTALRLGLGHSA
jgi:CAAX protease family protein